MTASTASVQREEQPELPQSELPQCTAPVDLTDSAQVRRKVDETVIEVRGQREASSRAPSPAWLTAPRRLW